jgi:hypothetical protein
MDLASADQAKEAKVAFRKVVGKAMWSNYRVPKRSPFSVNEVFNLMENLGLNQIKMVPPGVISPWRFGCKIAHFNGDVLQAMETLTADARSFYHYHLFPDSEEANRHRPGPQKNSFQLHPR